MFLLIFFIDDINDSKMNSTQNDHNHIIIELASKDYIYAIGAGVLSNRHGTLTLYNDDIRKRNMIPMGGWLVLSPHFYNQLDYYSIDNLYLALLREGIIIIARDGHLALLKTFMKENYSILVEFEPVIEVNSIKAFHVKEIN